MIKWQGIDDLEKHLETAATKATVAAAAALYQQGEAIMTESQQRYVPVDSGTLRSSGHVKKPQIKPGRVYVFLGYGGAASRYALVQHEAMHFRHTVGGPKYLERPVNAAATRVAVAVGAAIKKAIS